MKTRITVHISATTLEDARHEQGANFMPGICALLTDGGLVEVETASDTITFNTTDEFNAWFEGREGGTRPPRSEDRPIAANVRKIKLAGAVNVTVQQGPEPKMTVFCKKPGDLTKIWTTVEGDCLTIDSEPGLVVMYGKDGGVQSIGCNLGGAFTQSGDIINGRIINRGSDQVVGGSSNIQIGGGARVASYRVELTLPDVRSLRISGAGNTTYQGVQQDTLSLDISGAGNIEVAGSVRELEADVSGAGKILAFDLGADAARLRVSGAGSIKATAIRSVRARVSGVGKIKIAGNPPDRDTDVSGMGKIKFVDSKEWKRS